MFTTVDENLEVGLENVMTPYFNHGKIRDR